MSKILEYFGKGFFALILLLCFIIFIVFMIFLATFPIYALNELNLIVGIFSAIICWSSLLGLIIKASDC